MKISDQKWSVRIGFVLGLIWTHLPAAPCHQCTYQGVRAASSANAPHLATECITRDESKTEKWLPTADYSYGGLDDFCLHTQISDSKNLHESRRRNYRGIGSDFKLIQKLVRGNAWSFQRDGPIATANMDWNITRIKYQNMIKLANTFKADAKLLYDNITRLMKIKRYYNESNWDHNQTQHLLLNDTVFNDNATLERDKDVNYRLGKSIKTYLVRNALRDLQQDIGEDFVENAGKPNAKLYDADTLRILIKQQFPHKYDLREHIIKELDTPGPIVVDPFGHYKRYSEYKTWGWRLKKLLNMYDQYNATVLERRKLEADNCTHLYSLILKHYGGLKALIDNIEHNPFTAQYKAPNPYFVETSAIKVNGEIVKNFLHFRVFMNRSVSDNKSRLHSDAELKDNARGRIKAVIIIVKDQEGFPVGDFGRPIPCSRSCGSYSGPVQHHDTYRNDLPCVFTPPTANTHPGVFIWPGNSDGENQERFEGAREVHATWNFAQDSCNFVTELHVQTLVLENTDIELPGMDRLGSCGTSRTLKMPKCTDSSKTAEQKEKELLEYLEKLCPKTGRGHLFGWTARYNIIHPTLYSMGASDYVNVEELRDLNRRGTSIDCHVPLKYEYGFTKGRVPRLMTDIPSQAPYFLELMSEFSYDSQDLDILYYGTHYNGRLKCREPKLNDPARAGASATAELKKILSPPPIEDFMRTPGIRCPCPALPTTLDPNSESVTADPARLHGRLLHASHMSLAWMLLVPLAIFVCRYYKETFSLVFCFQEYWWFMWHIGLLLAAAVFIMGGVLAVSARKGMRHVASDEMIVHNVLGAMSIILFYAQIVCGFFRAADPRKRMRQIFFHWVLGIFNQTSACIAIIIMGFVRDSGMSCNALYTAGAWSVFYFTMFVIMEIHMRAVDKQLELVPKRSYLPPPMKRLFGRDAPYRNFRICMLGIFIIGMLGFYFLMAYFIWHSDGISCADENNNGTMTGSAAGGSGGGGGDAADYEYSV